MTRRTTELPWSANTKLPNGSTQPRTGAVRRASEPACGRCSKAALSPAACNEPHSGRTIIGVDGFESSRGAAGGREPDDADFEGVDEGFEGVDEGFEGVDEDFEGANEAVGALLIFSSP